MLPRSQKGSLSIFIPIVLLLLFSIGGAVMYFVRHREKVETTYHTANSQIYMNNTQSQQRSETGSNNVDWEFNGLDWQAMGTPPACPTPLIQSPINVSQATAILYPGQTRGGDYKPHGGFRFDTTTNNMVTVTIPLDAKVIRGARYLVNGETQYTFDFINDCGMMYRLGHLLTLSEKFKKIADVFPPAVENDSRTTPVNPQEYVKSGEIVATKVGVTAGHNTFLDFGVYDLRSKNNASKNGTWAAQHDAELAQHAVCWFTLLPAQDQQRIVSLPPGDPASGKTSDYCK